MSLFHMSALHLDAWTSYAIALALPLLDAVLPLVPSEAALVALGVSTAGSADPRIGLIITLAAFGAFLGDNLAYSIGRRFENRVSPHVFAGDRGRRRKEWAERSLERYGARLIIAARFIPGGRTAVTVTSGIVRYDRRRFTAATAAAGLIWAVYAFSVGRVGGRAFQRRPWEGFLLALGLAVAISVLIEVLRRVLNARSRRASTGHRISTAAQEPR
jgi:membrane-associated protein